MCEWELKFYMDVASNGVEFAGVIKVKFYYKLQ